MEPTTLKIWRTSYLATCLSVCLLGSQYATATAYTYPGNASAPLIMSNADTLIVNSGTLETSSSSSTSYTIDFSTATATGVTITVDSPGTISYQGTNSSGAAINSSRNSTGTVTNTITINGTVDSGTGLYAIYLNNSNASPNDTYNITNTGTITGTIISGGVETIVLNLDGSAANVNGAIVLSHDSGGFSTLNVLNGANFATSYDVSDITTVSIQTGSSMSFNNATSNIKTLTISNNGTATINNYSLIGVSSSDGNITNNGTMNIAANILKTGNFTGSGTNVVSEAVTVSTANYTTTNHTALLNDLSSYGNMTLSDADFASTNFAVTYGGSGYFSGGTYTLMTSVDNTFTEPTYTSVPTSTLFLGFNTPYKNGNSINIDIDRTPFNTFATTSVTQNIGTNLETIGSNNPSDDMLALLNAMNASTTASQVESSLQQLAPLSNAPLYGIEIQDTSIYQVELRLASLRDDRHYIAGDIAKDNHIWLRPFGTYANQKPKDDSFGYYGSSGGITAGFDRNLGDNYTIGAAGGYVLSHVKEKINAQSSTVIKSYIGMVYGSYDFTETRYLDWIIAVIANEFDTQRNVNINSYSQIATSSYGSQQVSFKGIWAKDYAAFDFMQLTPLASAQYSFVKQYSYTESGGAGTNLNIERNNSNIVQLALGAKAAVPLWVDPSIILPEIHALVFYNPILSDQNTLFSFSQGGVGDMTSFFNLNRTGLIYGAALTIAVVDKLEVKFNLDIDVEDRFNGYTAYLNLRYFL